MTGAHANGEIHRKNPPIIPIQLDNTDSLIVSMLKEDGRATLSQLASASGLSVSAVQSRVQKLEHSGIIAGYRAVIDYEKIGLLLTAFVALTPLDYTDEDKIPERLHGVEGIASCVSVTGAPSYILTVRVASPHELENLLTHIHSLVPVTTECTIILQSYFEY